MLLIFYGHSMIQPLPYDEIKIWHGDPDLHMNKFDDILKTPDDSDIGFFVEFDPKHPDKRKETKTSHLLLKIKLLLKINITII